LGNNALTVGVWWLCRKVVGCACPVVGVNVDKPISIEYIRREK